MNCVECHRALPEMIEGPRSAELNAHLASCAECSALVAELNAISREARLLQAVEEPTPRVWNKIEAQLRSEGLIHPPQPRQTWGMLPGTGWRPFVWMAPVAAALIAGALFLMNPRSTTNSDQANVQVASAPDATAKSKAALNNLELVVSVDTHMSETALMADYVIPGTRVLGPEFAAQMKSVFATDLADSQEITAASWRERPPTDRLKETAASLWARLL